MGDLNLNLFSSKLLVDFRGSGLIENTANAASEAVSGTAKRSIIITSQVAATVADEPRISSYAPVDPAHPTDVEVEAALNAGGLGYDMGMSIVDYSDWNDVVLGSERSGNRGVVKGGGGAFQKGLFIVVTPLAEGELSSATFGESDKGLWGNIQISDNPGGPALANFNQVGITVSGGNAPGTDAHLGIYSYNPTNMTNSADYRIKWRNPGHAFIHMKFDGIYAA